MTNRRLWGSSLGCLRWVGVSPERPYPLYFMVLLVLAACVPARTPPQLDATPGPSFTVTAETYTNIAFTVARPPGWRVISSGADAPPGVIFVAPDDTALIQLTTGPLDDTPPRPETDLPLRTETTTIALADATLTAYFAGPGADWDTLQSAWDLVLVSVS